MEKTLAVNRVIPAVRLRYIVMVEAFAILKRLDILKRSCGRCITCLNVFAEIGHNSFFVGNLLEGLASMRSLGKSYQTILAAIDDLLVFGREPSLRVSDIVHRADIGRSTFYEYFANVDEAFATSVGRPLGIFAESSLGLRTMEELVGLVDHFSLHRARAQELWKTEDFRRAAIPLLARLYFELLSEQVPSEAMRQPLSQHLAIANLGILFQWLSSEFTDKDCLAKLLRDHTVSAIDLFLNSSPTGS